jgi:LytS/YehU family sensor histidine kinase
LQFDQDQRDLEIGFVLPNPLQPDLVEYQYKMEDIDETWVSTRNRSVRYPKLPGGNFRFLVKGREGHNEFTAITALELTIEKRLIERWWFWLFSISFLSVIVSGGFWLRIRAVRKEEKIKAKFQQDLAEVQMQALRSQMNPHFLFNCLNSIKYYTINKSKDETADYLSKFSLLVRTILNNSKSDTVNLNDELEAIKLYIEIENLRLENKFEYHIEIDPTVEISQVKIPPMVLQPYVENAIWHGLMPLQQRGKLTLQVKNLGDRIQCIIEDNGIGRKATRKLSSKTPKYKKSLGMQITLDRIQLLEKVYGVETKISIVDLILANGSPGGTRVIVEIPMIDVKD